MKYDVDPFCDISGKCEAYAADRKLGFSNCVHCGKQLYFKDDEWWTWDADQYPHPRPQGETNVEYKDDV